MNELLKISKIDAGTAVFAKERVDAEALVEKALEPLSIPMELREQAVVREMEDRAGFTGDAAWTVEALGNILKNCMEQAGENGSLLLSCKDTLLYTELEIRDSGPGFSTEDLPHLFERFYRGKSANPDGYGIGLSLCRTIIVQQGGTITARNHPQGGAVFTIRFPK